MKFFSLVDRGVLRLSSWGLIICVFLMLSMSVLSIVLRWFNSSIHWLEPMVRHLVFISAFLGGVLATGRKTHIGIDILSKYFESRKMWTLNKWAGRVISLVSTCTLIWLIYSSFNFISIEAKYGKEAFLGIHSKYLVSIIPVGFSLMAYRFFYLFLSSFTTDETEGEK